MKKFFEVVAIVLACVVFTSIPVSLYGWDLVFPKYFPDGAIKGTIHLGKIPQPRGPQARPQRGTDWQFVGVKSSNDLIYASHAAWGIGTSDVIEIIHPDPNVDPAIVRWMNQNNIDWAITFFVGDHGPNLFWVTRKNFYGGGYSTLYYDGAY